MLGNRIKRARKAMGLSLRGLAEQLAPLTHTAIQNYENGKTTPSSDILIKLAKILHVRVEYFFRPERVSLENIQYRKHANVPAKQLESIMANILDKAERRIEFENIFPNSPIKSFSPKIKAKGINNLDAIEDIADQLRKDWELGFNPIPNLIDLLEERGIKIFEITNKKNVSVDGLYATVNNSPIIVVASNNQPGDRQRFTLAHELGHILLEDHISENLDIESCCDRFAGAFLLPKRSLINLLGRRRHSIEPRELNLLKHEFGISMTSILHRAQETSIIPTRLYREIRSQFNKQGWNIKEPGEPYNKERTYIFEQLVFHAFAEQYISEAKAAELLNLSLESFRPLRAMEN